MNAWIPAAIVVLAVILGAGPAGAGEFQSNSGARLAGDLTNETLRV